MEQELHNLTKNAVEIRQPCALQQETVWQYKAKKRLQETPLLCASQINQTSKSSYQFHKTSQERSKQPSEPVLCSGHGCWNLDSHYTDWSVTDTVATRRARILVFPWWSDGNNKCVHEYLLQSHWFWSVVTAYIPGKCPIATDERGRMSYSCCRPGD